jgi:putative redox protein
MKVEIESLRIAVEGRLTDVHPKVYHTIVLKYIFKGKDLDRTKLTRAIELSQEKYCGVTAMLRTSVEIDYEIIIEE